MSDLADIAPAKPLKPCEHVEKVPRTPEQYRQRYSARMTLASAVASMERELADAWAKDQATHAENSEAIAFNTVMKTRLTEIMKAAGIEDTYRAEVPSRSQWRKWKTFPAGYIGDLNRCFPVDDKFGRAMQLHGDRVKALEEAKVLVEREKQEQERAQAAAAERRKADLALAGIIIRYQLGEDTTWSDALEALRKRNKYLDLAVAGLLTRGDWSDGFYRVEDALGRFTIESDRDKDIAADLCGCLRSDHGDGRIFRDTTWSYDKLFDLVEDKQLLADAQTCMEHVSE